VILSLPGEQSQFDTLMDIIARLRAPDGCPWDRKQTHSSLRQHFLEECYEVLEALDEGNPDKLCQELGDLLLHIVIQARIASEAKKFDIEDVISGISGKLINRHPHVFGSTEVKDADEVILNWEALKRREKDSKSSILDSVPKQMPALMYSQEIQHRAAQAGFDWEDIDGIIDKLAEEIREYKQAENSEEKEREFGDLLFTLANIARRMDIDLETVLRETNRRFYQRFSYMEEICRNKGQNVGNLSFDEQNALWEEAKKALLIREI